ncbi:UV excision repair protein Rad23 [Pneumocystis murina B123]|uniref:UV excision repair protein RAD23 n=1 Tax=Pneumocystis murina (strain B123) TaxID=1069680 RepID=M7P2W0_PNEMU|nr:UV excision repair protein Rad23 [Pneumocystis murina B123]EMR08195.1 UV excision repair protein Rad23 [Pneumocystis murina B123]
MKLTFKNLNQQKFVIEDVDPMNTILQVKEKIQEVQGHDSKCQKLVYSGKILADDKTVESYNIKEKDFIVCMVQKPKQVASSSVATESNVSTESIQDSESGKIKTMTSSSEAPTLSSGVFSDPNSLVIGQLRDTAVENMVEMGYGRTEVENAMRAAFNNPDRAVEYLLTGIPEHLSQELSQHVSLPQPVSPSQQTLQTQQVPQPTSVPTSNRSQNLFELAAQVSQQGRERLNSGSGNSLGGSGSTESLAFLRNNPQFQMLRRLIQTQPHMLESVLQQLAQGNLQLATLINQNSEAFLQLLSEEIEGEDTTLTPNMIQLTEEERQAIERLEALGFSRGTVVQAYFACDKNEEMTANYLFEHGHESDEEIS